MRFARPALWFAFVDHVRRGGYASDLKDPIIRREFRQYRNALERGEQATLRPLRHYGPIPGTEWFAAVSVDGDSMRDADFRPR